MATVWLKGDFCDSNRITYMVRPWLFFNGELAGWRDEGQHPNLPTRNEAGLYIVEGHIYVRNSPHEMPLHEAFREDPAQEFHDKFDLERNPHDICMYVRGASSAMYHPYYAYESNKVRISKEEIAAALQREL